MDNIGKAILEAMSIRGVATQDALADKARISQAHLSNVLNGRDRPSIKLLDKIADALSCELEIRFRLKEEPQASPSSSAAHRPARGSPDNIRYLGDDPLVLLSLAREKIKAQAANLSPDERAAVGLLLSLCARHLDGDEEQLKEG